MRTRSLAIVLIVVLACGSFFVWSRPSLAQPSATFTVTNTIDAVDTAPGDGICDIGDGSCTLRAAIQEANALAGADTVSVPAGLYPLTIAGTLEDLAATGDLDIADDLLIQGAGAASTIIDGGQLDQVFQIIGTSDVTFSGLAIQHGLAAGWVDPSGNRHEPMGGAILNPAGSVTVSDSVLAGNQSPEIAGAIYNNGQLTIERSALHDNQIIDAGDGGAIVNDPNGVLTISASQFVNNSTSDAGIEGGAIAAYGGTVSIDGSEFVDNIADAGGAIFSSAPSLTISNSTFRGNEAWQAQSTSGGGGAIYSSGSLTLSNDIFDGNYSGASGGAVYARGGLTIDTVWFTNNNAVIGGALLGRGDISNVTFSHNWVEPYEGNSQGGAMSGGGTLTNVTFSDNWAILQNPDGSFNEGGAFYGDGMFINVTFAGNRAYADDGQTVVDGSSIFATGELQVVNTIIGDTAGAASCSGVAITSLGHNIESGASCNFTQPSDRQNTDPMLLPLADNGGLSPTHALAGGSPAIDTGDPAHCPVTDERGVPRPLDGDGDGTAICDIGAYEAAPADTGGPTLQPTVSPNPVILNGTASASPNASDPSGIASASCDPVDTTTVGTHTVTCTATDTAGNTATATVSYDVTYAVTLRYDPEHPTRHGINVELPLSLTDANGANVSSASTSVTAITLLDASGQTVQTINKRFKYVKKSQSYTIKLKTKGLDDGTYQLVIHIAGDPVEHRAPFRVN